VGVCCVPMLRGRGQEGRGRPHGPTDVLQQARQHRDAVCREQGLKIRARWPGGMLRGGGPQRHGAGVIAAGHLHRAQTVGLVRRRSASQLQCKPALLVRPLPCIWRQWQGGWVNDDLCGWVSGHVGNGLTPAAACCHVQLPRGHVHPRARESAIAPAAASWMGQQRPQPPLLRRSSHSGITQPRTRCDDLSHGTWHQTQPGGCRGGGCLTGALLLAQHHPHSSPHQPRHKSVPTVHGDARHGHRGGAVRAPLRQHNVQSGRQRDRIVVERFHELAQLKEHQVTSKGGVVPNRRPLRHDGSQGLNRCSMRRNSPTPASRASVSRVNAHRRAGNANYAAVAQIAAHVSPSRRRQH